MLILHIFDMLWEILQPRNLLECLRSLPYMGIITWRSLHRRWVQTLVTIVAVSLGFSAHLCLLVVFGASYVSVEELLAEVNLPTPVVIRQQPGIAEGQFSQLHESHYVDGLQPALELTAYLETEQTRLMGFAPGDDFWEQHIHVIAGTTELTEAGILLPQSLAGRLGLTVGDSIRLVTHAGITGRLNKTALQVQAIFQSDYALFDQPLALVTSNAFNGYDIKQPTLLFVDCRPSEVQRVLSLVQQVLTLDISARPYPWLQESDFSPNWVTEAKQPYTLLWQGTKGSFHLDMAKQVLGNNYTSARRLVWLIYGFSALCVISILLITLLTRRRDIGILKSVGFDDIDIFTSFALEAAFVSGGGVLLGIGISQLAAVALSHITGYALSIGLGQVARSAMLSFILYLLAAMVPADMARYTPTIDLLREGALFNRWREDPTVLSNAQLVDRNRLA